MMCVYICHTLCMCENMCRSVWVFHTLCHDFNKKRYIYTIKYNLTYILLIVQYKIFKYNASIYDCDLLKNNSRNINV